MKTNIYLLGGAKKSPSYFRLVEAFAHQGSFLLPESDYMASYDRDSQQLFTMPPLLVFRPHTLECLNAFVKTCRDLDVSITARCGGTGYVGGATASQGGVIVLTGHFRGIYSYDALQGEIVVEPGLTIKQLNRLVQDDDWMFPLEMSTNGVAGIAGCISSHAQGYHQSHSAFLNSLKEVTFIDGKGESIVAPGGLLCGAEGLCGIVTKVRLKLRKRPQKRFVLQFEASLSSIIDRLIDLKKCSSITSFVRLPNGSLVFIVEGDCWRVEGALRYIKRYVPSWIELPSTWQINPVDRQPSFVLSHAISMHQVESLLQYMEHLCASMQLSCCTWVNLWEGSLHIRLSSQEDNYQFSKQMEQLLVLWIPFLEKKGGFIASQHGLGPYLCHYAPPFFREEEWYFWEQLFRNFDPNRLYGRHCFFPVAGKSLEKVISELSHA